MNNEAYLQGYFEKDAKSDVMRQLLAAKLASDKRDWATKNRILRKLIDEKQEDFTIDSDEGHVAGVTHMPSGFRMHMPKVAIPPGLMKSAESVNIPRFDKWKPSAGDVYSSIAAAEHRGSNRDRFVRAMKPKGSSTTAYGPVQMNRQFLADFTPGAKGERYSKIFKRSPELQKYVTDLHAQSGKFLEHGNEKKKLGAKYDPRYGYSNVKGTGRGVMGDTDRQRLLYEQTAKMMIKHRTKKEFGGDYSKYLQAHRGKTRAQDPKYYAAYDKAMKARYRKYIQNFVKQTRGAK